MANRQQKRMPRPTTNIVVRNGPAANQAGPFRASQARRRRNRRKPQQTVVRVLPNKNQGRRRGPRSSGFGNRMVVQRIVTTLGTVGSNGSGSIETELAVLLNPCTMKETTGSNTYGPVQIYASTYSLFMIRSLKLTLKPLVGGSAVSGTVIRTSWNPTSNPTQMSWSALGARKHSDTTPGREGKFILTAKDLKGPKDGWYRTNPKGEPMLSFAGSIEIHTFGETMRTYQTGRFTGGLFLAELEVVWAFKDYAQQPGLINLLKGDSTGDTKVTTDDEGRLILETPANTELARAARTNTTASEIIWMVTDAVVTSATALFPPPFNWLLKGGWWFLKKIGGAPGRTGVERFMIYASINDARASAPCVSTVTNADEVSVGQLHFQQITPGNTGVGPDIPAVRAIEYPVQTRPTRCYVTSSAMIKKGTTDLVPAACIWYNRRGGQMHQKGVGFQGPDKVVATFNAYKVNAMTDLGYINIDMFDHKVPIKFYGTSNYPLGWAVASSYNKVQDQHSIWVSSLLIYVEFPRAEWFDGSWHVTKVDYPNADYLAQVVTTQDSSSRVHLNFEREGWYILQYAVQGLVGEDYYVGDQVVATESTQTMTSIIDSYGNYTFRPTLDHARAGIFPAFATGLSLTPFKTNTVTKGHTRSDPSAQAPEQTIYSDTHPSFGCDDAFEFPPPPSEEDLADEACGFEPFSDSEAENFEDPAEDEDEELELGPDDDYSDPPISRLVVVPEAQQLYEQLRANFPEREARLAVNQLNPSGEYQEFISRYHNALVDGLSPREARAFALDL
ncbi:MAG: ORF2 [Zhejiang mamastrovirus 2]|nr:MAG: ORF2 [Zhejiang mamastrovirus 2]